MSAFSAELLDHDDVTNDDDDVALDCLRLVALVAVIDDVVEVFETGGDLIAAGVVELDEFGLDVPALVRVEVSPLEGGHAVVGEVLEASAPHVVVGVVVPGGRGLDVGPGHDGVVHHRHPALSL